jgi:hypothetical protein
MPYAPEGAPGIKLIMKKKRMHRQVGFVVDKMASGRFSPSTSVSPAKTFHSTNFSILTITRDRYSRPSNGRSAAWTQCGLHLPI